MEKADKSRKKANKDSNEEVKQLKITDPGPAHETIGEATNQGGSSSGLSGINVQELKEKTIVDSAKEVQKESPSSLQVRDESTAIRDLKAQVSNLQKQLSDQLATHQHQLVAQQGQLVTHQEQTQRQLEELKNLLLMRPSTAIPAKAKSPATRALLGSRKSSASRTSVSGSVSGPTAEKPVVIHQSLSTLSQPGQTGTVVWDSSILMSKFLLSIKDLTMGCYRAEELQRRAQEARKKRIRKQQKDQVRKLEEQAEHLAVSAEGDLEEVEATNVTEKKNKKQQGPGAGSQDRWSGSGNSSNNSDRSCSSDNSSTSGSGGNDSSDDDNDDSNDDSSDLYEEQEGEEEGEMLVFDPAETTVLELGSGCGLLGIVMAEL
ncbi:hypothetical protein BGZ58_004640, partial [Dissophora ornata]